MLARLLRLHPDLNPVAVGGLSGEVGAACVTRRDVLSSVGTADGVERTAEAGAVGGAQRPGRGRQMGNAGESTGAHRVAVRATGESGGFASPPSPVSHKQFVSNLLNKEEESGSCSSRSGGGGGGGGSPD